MQDGRLGFMYYIQNKGSHCSPRDRVEWGAPLPGGLQGDSLSQPTGKWMISVIYLVLRMHQFQK